MTREEIEKAAALAERATPAPWESECGGAGIPTDPSFAVVHYKAPVYGSGFFLDWTPTETDPEFRWQANQRKVTEQSQRDAAFMASARTLVPSLAATCLELLARAEKAEAELAAWNAEAIDPFVKQRDAYEAALALIIDNTDSCESFEPELAARTLGCIRNIAERALESKKKGGPK